MNELIKQADDLIAKINRLLDKTDLLSADLLAKDEQIRQLQRQVKDQAERLRIMEEERVSKRTAETIQVQLADTREVKKKINDYIRELDKCIAKLSAEG